MKDSDLLPLLPSHFDSENNSDNKEMTQTLTINNYIQAATSDNTRKAYRQDVQHFIHWGGLLPATSEIIVNYLLAFASRLNSRTLTRRLTALKNWHIYQGFPDPTSHVLVRKTLTGIRHIHGKPKEKAAAMNLEQLIQMTNYLRHQISLSDLRNLALIQVGFFGAFRRSELVAIRWEDIHFVTEGMEILIPRSKTDQSGEGQMCAIPYGEKSLCPVTALINWCETARIESGYVFRHINQKEELGLTHISTQSVNIILKSIAKHCQLVNPEQFSSHSLRRGFATTASRKGVPFNAIMRHGRWKHEATVLGYIEEGQKFEENAAGIILSKMEK